MKYILLFSFGACLFAITQAVWGPGFNMDVKNGVNWMHHGPIDMKNVRMAQHNDYGVMTMNHAGGQSMGVNLNNRFQFSWNPRQRRFVKRSIENVVPDTEIESVDTISEDQKDIPESIADETVEKNMEVDELDKVPAEEQSQLEGLNQNNFGEPQTVGNSKGPEESSMGSNGLIWHYIRGRNKYGGPNLGIAYVSEPGQIDGDGIAKGVEFARSYGGTGMAMALANK